VTVEEEEEEEEEEEFPCLIQVRYLCSKIH
jgi:hypothetical protein